MRRRQMKIISRASWIYREYRDILISLWSCKASILCFLSSSHDSNLLTYNCILCWSGHLFPLSLFSLGLDDGRTRRAGNQEQGLESMQVQDWVRLKSWAPACQLSSSLSFFSSTWILIQAQILIMMMAAAKKVVLTPQTSCSLIIIFLVSSLPHLSSSLWPMSMSCTEICL